MRVSVSPCVRLRTRDFSFPRRCSPRQQQTCEVSNCSSVPGVKASSSRHSASRLRRTSRFATQPSPTASIWRTEQQMRPGHRQCDCQSPFLGNRGGAVVSSRNTRRSKMSSSCHSSHSRRSASGRTTATSLALVDRRDPGDCVSVRDISAATPKPAMTTGTTPRSSGRCGSAGGAPTTMMTMATTLSTRRVSTYMTTTHTMTSTYTQTRALTLVEQPRN